MKYSLNLDIPPLKKPISYADKVLLLGSCFTEHIADRLQQHKFDVLANPHGILFNPLSVAHSIDSYLSGKVYTKDDLFYLNELWNSWDHHTRFSDTDADHALAGINHSGQAAAGFIRSAGWVIITLGSAFQYYLKDNSRHIANNHRAPAQWFEKKLLSVDEITVALSSSLQQLAAVNPQAQVLLTISPVRHIRDGVVENNRSKARLIESVHQLCSSFNNVHYFPAYELIIDILRDYRFYDIDYVHPNFLATNYVWERFVQACIAPDNYPLMEAVNDIMTACRHRPRFSDTAAHQQFRATYAQKINRLIQLHPFLNLSEEKDFFSL